jgi:hypothetical protein
MSDGISDAWGIGVEELRDEEGKEEPTSVIQPYPDLEDDDNSLNKED